ncbi:MAG: hypothetical protein HY608_06375 [Planctomycetes bacterium]|nr:hypothetical protein [Planctomycetota bacterium]
MPRDRGVEPGRRARAVRGGLSRRLRHDPEEPLRGGRGIGGGVVHARVEDPQAIPRGEASWDEVLFDPPFAWCGSTEGRTIISEALQRVAQVGVLAAEGRVWLRVERRSGLRPEVPGLVLGDERSYGDSLVLRYERGAA